MDKGKSFLIKYFFVYAGFNLALIPLIIYKSFIETLDFNDVGEGIALHLVFSLLLAVEFLIIALIFFFLEKSILSKKTLLFLAFVSNSLLLLLSEGWRAIYFWQELVVYTGIIIAYILFRKFIYLDKKMSENR